jgi:heme exporter protein CcmD
MIEFLAMKGYGFYIWSAYGVAALAIALELSSLRSRRKAVTEEARLTAPEETIDASGAGQ